MASSRSPCECLRSCAVWNSCSELAGPARELRRRPVTPVAIDVMEKRRLRKRFFDVTSSSSCVWTRGLLLGGAAVRTRVDTSCVEEARSGPASASGAGAEGDASLSRLARVDGHSDPARESTEPLALLPCFLPRWPRLPVIEKRRRMKLLLRGSFTNGTVVGDGERARCFLPLRRPLEGEVVAGVGVAGVAGTEVVAEWAKVAGEEEGVIVDGLDDEPCAVDLRRPRRPVSGRVLSDAEGDAEELEGEG
jgi:hypothetical protein